MPGWYPGGTRFKSQQFGFVGLSVSAWSTSGATREDHVKGFSELVCELSVGQSVFGARPR